MKQKIILISIFSLLIMVNSLKVGMFWDNILIASEMGNHLFNNGIFNWNIPIESDPGHPPFLATLMAIGWTFFGKSLAVSHWIMIPFIFGLLWQIYSFVSFFIKNKSLQFWTFLLIIADPTLSSQLFLVNPEVIQLFFFFTALNALLRNTNYLKIIALSFLGIVTYRGMMLCAGIFLIELLFKIIIKKETFNNFFTKRLVLSYFISATPAIFYLIWRLLNQGWIISHPMEIWGNAWQYSSFVDFIKNFSLNFLVLIQRFTDFGRIILLLFSIITLYLKRKLINWKVINTLLIIFFFSTIVIYSLSLFINNPMGHRYYISSYITLGLISAILIQEFKFKKLIYLGLLSSLILGNFIIYSDNFSQGWDSSLAHLPYWKLRKNAIEYLDKNNISISATATFFPNSTTIDNIVINGDMRRFLNFSGNEKYVLYSNIFNLTDEEFSLLYHNYNQIKLFEKHNIKIEILKNIKFN